MGLDAATLRDFLTRAAVRHTGSSDWVKKYAEDAARELGVDETDFAARLTAAGEAHHAYEAELGKPDEEWAGWYATHMTQ